MDRYRLPLTRWWPDPSRLMHTTTALDAIRASGQLYGSSGCLLAALYCAPLTRSEPACVRTAWACTC
ncbi:hypothetical protein [Streptomyces sp. H27-D2]|uniref:hypothetical protein n=1 Tax=Streptomyces sp. H27-D2 TaxID=3046304 RepID=UPI002DBF199A|nr:hypothetical protein [Streptomyces sp. H27-D2]MEC4020699.1 hypothetical protein [Streptomyces sp. H27-D2]